MSKQVIAGVAVAPGQVVRGVKGLDVLAPEVPAIGTIWYHSAIAKMPEMTWDAFQARMMNMYGVTVLYRSMQDDPGVEWEDELDLSEWKPQNPFVSDEAFMLVLSEDEDGPFAVWALPGSYLPKEMDA